MVNKLLLCMFAVCFLAACSRQDASAPATAAVSFDSVYAAAVDAMAAAESRGVVWTTSDTLLQESEVANAEGRVKEAIVFATEARLHAQLAVQQADGEKEAWRQRVPRN